MVLDTVVLNEITRLVLISDFHLLLFSFGTRYHHVLDLQLGVNDSLNKALVHCE